ncbi:outer membrane beta-barrel protein [Vibrio penaeicida]|uniref:outer membrane beta-barrel protein n=1 Tax=Vibrio penaeicida TaxID=104609 RepID=UPI000CEA2E5B|nr:outer membrane beta-barrel protein [Vibrio penaeicida]
MKKLALTLLMSAISASAIAEGRFYVGADLSKDTYELAPGAEFKSDGMGFAIQGGYDARFSEMFSVATELEYAKYSNAKVTSTIPFVGKFSFDQKLSTISLNLKPKLYVGNVYVGAPLGLGYGMVDQGATIQNQLISGNIVNGVVIHYGAELGIDIMEQFVVKGGYKKNTLNYSSFYAGIGYKF